MYCRNFSVALEISISQDLSHPSWPALPNLGRFSELKLLDGWIFAHLASACACAAFAFACASIARADAGHAVMLFSCMVTPRVYLDCSIMGLRRETTMNWLCLRSA